MSEVREAMCVPDFSFTNSVFDVCSDSEVVAEPCLPSAVEVQMVTAIDRVVKE